MYYYAGHMYKFSFCCLHVLLRRTYLGLIHSFLTYNDKLYVKIPSKNFFIFNMCSVQCNVHISIFACEMWSKSTNILYM